jgi:ATP/maltotriose-dependent transcriptional regulator MalT
VRRGAPGAPSSAPHLARKAHHELLGAVRAVARGEAIFSQAVIAQGHPNPSIARKLSLSPKTVANYVSAIFAKLQVADRAEAMVRAREAGLGS